MRGRLYRSRTDSMIGGVCGGLGEYLGVDPVLVRLAFVVATMTGMSVLVYLLLWIVVPREGQEDASPEEVRRSGAQEIADQARSLGDAIGGGQRGSNSSRGMLFGGALVLLGVMLLLENLHIYWLRWINWDLVWPLFLILGGLVLIQRRARTI